MTVMNSPTKVDEQSQPLGGGSASPNTASMTDQTSANNESIPMAAAAVMEPLLAGTSTATKSYDGNNPPVASHPQVDDPGVVSDAAASCSSLTMAKDVNNDKMPATLAAASAFPTVSSLSDPTNNNFGNSSSSESEHLATTMTTSTSGTTSASVPSLSSSTIDSASLSTNNINNNNSSDIDVNNTRPSPLPRLRSTKTTSPTPSNCIIASRPSSLSSKSRGSQSSSRCANKPHAYFASSEEESEAELDEKDSHCSSIASNNNYSHHVSSQSARRSSLRGSKKLAEIASGIPSLQSSRVRMTIPPNHDGTLSSTPGIGRKGESIGKSGNNNAVPPPPQTVTVAVGKNNSSDGQTTTLPPISSSLPHPSSSTTSSSLRNSRTAVMNNNPSSANNLPPYSSPIRKRIRKKRHHKHLPRGLPVFKDPRSCMWTSTYDANAPSEDRYSSLVNVLLRPPKTPRGGGNKGKSKENDKKADNGGNDNNGTTNNAGGGSKSGSSCCGSVMSEGGDDENAAENQGMSQSTLPHNNTTATGRSGNRAHHKTEDDEDDTSLIRLSLWSVIDGHGGGCVATYAAEVLLPHIAASVARALKSEIVDRGVCNVNGQLRDANALDLDGLIRTSDRSRHVEKSQVRQREAGIDVVNPNSIHYRSPFEDSESEGDVGVDHIRRRMDDEEETRHPRAHVDPGVRSESESEAESEAPASVASSLLPGNPITHEESVSSVKTSVKTAVGPMTQHAPGGTHSPAEVASITRAITDSFLAVDEGWINSIDPVTTHQTSCVSNGRWNAGACALVVFTVQRLDWCRSSRVDHEMHHRERGASGFEDTSHNKDAARRRKLDYASKSKSVSSLSTLSSTSSIATEANTAESMLAEESEITETEDDDHHHHDIDDDPHHQEGVFIATPAGCKCHYYRPHDAMLYTAHVGDCRAVMLGSAPPRTIKVPPEGDSRLSLDHSDRSEDENSSESIADEISSSEHDSDSSEDIMMEDHEDFMRGAGRGSHALGYVRRAAAKRQRRNENAVIEQPFVPLPPLKRQRTDFSSEESAVESDDSTSTTAQEHLLPVGSIVHTAGGVVVTGPVVDVNRDRVGPGVFNNLSEEEPTQLVADPVHPPPLPLSMLMRPIDLTTDHSAYNPAEVTAVLRRCNNAPKAISSASSGGIKRVAGSLAVTRALGDAYLKTPRLSFFPYKRHAPYITGRPEVNCRVLTKGADRILTLASDGVWERASGDDVLRWVRNYYNARIAGVKDQHLHDNSMYDLEEAQHDRHAVEECMPRRKRLATEEGVLSGGNNSGNALGNNSVAAAGGGSASELSSEEDGSTTAQEKSANLKTPPVDASSKKPDGVAVAAAAVRGSDEKVEDSDAATTTTADETTTMTKTGTKPKHPSSASASTAVDDSVSSRSEITESSTTRHRGGTTMTTSRPHRHLRSSASRPYSLSIPTVSDVIVRKVLNKVRKTRNISSLRMLMSLPKGRARRSKHDDITATVVDLSGFVS